LSRASGGLPSQLSRATSRSDLRLAVSGATDRVSEDGRSHAVLRVHAPVDDVRHVHRALVRWQPRWHRLEAAGIRSAAHVSTAVWLLRSGLSRLHARRGADEMSARTYRDTDTVDFVIVGSG